jgi:hypothetical protein
MKIVNLAPHALVFFSGDTPLLTVQPSGTIACCQELPVAAGALETEGVQIPLVQKAFGPLVGLLETEVGTVFVTSALAAQPAWAAGRTDVFTVGDPVRDEQGKILGARSLCANPSG